MDSMPLFASRRSAHRCSRAVLLLAVTVLLGAAEGRAARRFLRTLDDGDGLTTPDIRSLAQDARGFLWIGTMGGLYRYDGVEMRTWAPEALTLPIVEIATDHRGGVAVVDRRGSLYELSAEAAHPVLGDDSEPVRDAQDAAFGPDGTLWLARPGGLHARSPTGRWRVVAGGGLESVFPLESGEVYAATAAAVLRVTDGGDLATVAAVPDVESLIDAPGGGLAAITRHLHPTTLGPGGTVVRISEGSVEELHHLDARGIDLARRGDTIWASFSRYLVALREGSPAEVLSLADGVAGGGPLLVDREGSLWVGTFIGLHQFPEPETRIWGELEGLPSDHTRYVARQGDDLWVSTWQGLGLLRRRPEGGLAAVETGLIARGELCTDAEGGLWVGQQRGVAEDVLVRIRAGSVPDLALGALEAGISACHLAADGDLWLATAAGELFHVPQSTMVPEAVELAALSGPPGEAILGLLVDSEGRLWIGVGERICRGPAAAVLGGDPGAVSCQAVPGSLLVRTLVELPSGALWAATEERGVLRREGDGWEPIPAGASLPSPAVMNLVPSPSGGIWVLGHGFVLRVAEAPETEGGWRVVKRLGRWHGLPSLGGEDLLEEEDGDLWITTSRGVYWLPRSIRYSSPEPPLVELVEVRVDERPLPLDRPPEIPHWRNRVELRFAALSFRDPGLLRYQVRRSPDREWRQISQASFRFVDLPAGNHVAAIRASLDGERWSPQPARYAFTVTPPWWLRWWALVLFAGALAVTLFGIYRWRVDFLLRLERQRTRIAMDLHDEMGSGLGSIGILSELLSHGDLDEEDRSRMAERIAETSEELGASLSDIVWSLREDSATLEELGSKLAEHAGGLFADRDVELEVAIDANLPSQPLPLAMRRNLLLVGLEALHNAARHAEASHVRLALVSDDGAWRLAVADDGVGIPPGSDSGMGLENMRRRAGEMGGRLELRDRKPKGTVVSLRFRTRDPRGR